MDLRFRACGLRVGSGSWDGDVLARFSVWGSHVYEPQVLPPRPQKVSKILEILKAQAVPEPPNPSLDG